MSPRYLWKRTRRALPLVLIPFALLFFFGRSAFRTAHANPPAAPPMPVVRVGRPYIIPAPAPFRNESAANAQVYVTRTGACYHRPWCRSLRYSAIPTTARTALSIGMRPCRLCRPPLP